MGEKHSDHPLRLSLKDRNALRGLLINASNAIRLQVSSLPPTSFLRNYLHSHSTWNEFLPRLRQDTMLQHPPGMGHYVPTPETRNANYIAALMVLHKTDGEGIDHGSNYAKFLGFEEEIEWPEDNIEPKKKKKNKKKKKKNKRRRGKSDLSEDDLESSGSDCQSEELSDDDDETDESESDNDRRASIGTDGSASSGEEEVEVPTGGQSKVTADLDEMD